jgi:hypothetical protein
MQFRGVPTDPEALDALGRELVSAWLSGQKPASKRTRLVSVDDVRSALGLGPEVVVPLRAGAPIHNDRKANFLRHVAASFDSYVLKHGYDPDALVMVFGGLKQSAEPYWIIRGESEGGATTMLAFAQATLQREIAN